MDAIQEGSNNYGWFKGQMSDLEYKDLTIEKGEYMNMVRQILLDIKRYTTVAEHKE
eukprot:CAMPEP_0116972576 /NCGR_PEP_ID=MMETSP0467-20121206/53935_1 /TAXON_ID=283647 /ORGANISM="Mesodinium pulex, Strain SPMC105" /LENGTH=55 /DNA_ID=CAMNT_0004664115 /DNA_START=288 /DNA_END=455 /DNA_ORIENTATION=-